LGLFGWYAPEMASSDPVAASLAGFAGGPVPMHRAAALPSRPLSSRRLTPKSTSWTWLDLPGFELPVWVTPEVKEVSKA